MTISLLATSLISRLQGAEKLFEKIVVQLKKAAALKRLVVGEAILVCDATIPPQTPNNLFVEPLRPQVVGHSLACVTDDVRDVNIRPWPCKCRLRPSGSDFLPCDYKPAGRWTPGVASQMVASHAAGVNQKAYDIMQRLIEEGYSEAGAAGIVGNILVETGEFAHYQEVGGGGVGWLQWTGPRRTNYLNWCDAQGMDPTSDDANWAYMIAEMNGVDGQQWTGGGSIAGLNAQTDPAAAAEYYMKHYERPGIPHLDRRMDYATALMGQKAAALPENATHACTWGGTLSIADPGQDALRADPNGGGG